MVKVKTAAAVCLIKMICYLLQSLGWAVGLTSCCHTNMTEKCTMAPHCERLSMDYPVSAAVQCDTIIRIYDHTRRSWPQITLMLARPEREPEKH